MKKNILEWQARRPLGERSANPEITLVQSQLRECGLNSIETFDPHDLKLHNLTDIQEGTW